MLSSLGRQVQGDGEGDSLEDPEGEVAAMSAFLDPIHFLVCSM